MLKDFKLSGSSVCSVCPKKAVIARTPHLMRGTWQSHEILRFAQNDKKRRVRNDIFQDVDFLKLFTIIS